MPPIPRTPIRPVGKPLPKPSGALNPTTWKTDELAQVVAALEQEAKDLRLQQKALVSALDGAKFTGTWDVTVDLTGRLGTAHNSMIEAYGKYIDAVEKLAARLRATAHIKKTAETDSLGLVQSSPAAQATGQRSPANFS